MTKKQIKKIAIINAVCVCFAFIVFRVLMEIEHSSYAVWLWGPLGYWIMKKQLLLPEDDSDANNIDNEDCESNTANANNVAKTNVDIPKTNDVSLKVENIQTVSFCRKCGNKLIPNSAFCPFCGANILELNERLSKESAEKEQQRVQAWERDKQVKNYNSEATLKRAFLFLEDGDFDRADTYFENVLDQDPENAWAYVGKLMIDLRITIFEQLKDANMPFNDNKNYIKALRFGDNKLKNALNSYIAHICNRNEIEGNSIELEEIKSKKSKKTVKLIALLTGICASLAIIGYFVIYPFCAYLTGNYRVYIEMYNVENFSVPNDVTSIGDRAFYGCESLKNVTIPDSVESIGDRAFYGCESLKNVTIPDSAESIGDYAFLGCESLKNVTIPDGVTSIRGGTFSYCYSLTSVMIPDSVTSIGGYAFSNCTSLTSVTIGNSVESIGNSAFKDCKALEKIYFNATAMEDFSTSN